ncbi:MAG: ATP-binding protein [Negativicutes bacterium]|nr:ATP-binding protein [Negativicutes bacterium]
MHELALHILDMVQNCLDAGASEVVLEIVEDQADDVLLIRVSDNGRGMTAEQVAQVRSPFYTSRTTRRVGLGVPLIDMTTAQCGGHLKIESRPGKGTVMEACYRLSHIDRPPLGDMAGTLKTLLIGSQDVDFTYRHTVDGRQFALSSRELQEALAGVPFYDPEVWEWLSGYLRENFCRLYGGATE